MCMWPIDILLVQATHRFFSPMHAQIFKRRPLGITYKLISKVKWTKQASWANNPSSQTSHPPKNQLEFHYYFLNWFVRGKSKLEMALGSHVVIFWLIRMINWNINHISLFFNILLN